MVIGNTSKAYDEFFRDFKIHDSLHDTEEVCTILAYVDAQNLAHCIKGSVKMVHSLMMFAILSLHLIARYNRLECEKEYSLMQEYAYVHNKVFN